MSRYELSASSSARLITLTSTFLINLHITKTSSNNYLLCGAVNMYKAINVGYQMTSQCVNINYGTRKSLESWHTTRVATKALIGERGGDIHIFAFCAKNVL